MIMKINYNTMFLAILVPNTNSNILPPVFGGILFV